MFSSSDVAKNSPHPQQHGLQHVQHLVQQQVLQQVQQRRQQHFGLQQQHPHPPPPPHAHPHPHPQHPQPPFLFTLEDPRVSIEIVSDDKTATSVFVTGRTAD
ncbi:hypothetical protein L5515_014165 [Caenorhabditis briggsae]|uniref:Uncharacterized protein n=1 Tax=Caenorhabditis briggsae TaxID=6238 RepID=A0AAE9J7W9_CAEBR|nr:hypothetical protein L5515_014165 [Caenorhabditis briggsae]